MVTTRLLYRVDNATDIEAYVINLPKPYDRYQVVFWYRDTTYGSDSFGCTSIPNIFHWWVLDKTQLNGQVSTNIPHVNLFGDECRAEVLFRGVQFFMRNGLKMLVSGYTYGTYRKFAALFDMSNPLTPSLIKKLEDVGTGSWWNKHKAAYVPRTDEIYVLSLNGDVRYARYNDFINATDFSSLSLVGNIGLTNATDGLYLFDDTRLIVTAYAQLNLANKWFGFVDVTTKTLTRNTTLETSVVIFNMGKYTLGLTISGGVLTRIDVYDKTPSLLRTYTVNMQIYTMIDLGDYVGIVLSDRRTIRVFNLTDGTYFDITLPEPIFGLSMNIGGRIYGFKWVSDINTTGELYEITLDSYYYLDYDPATKRAVLRDQAGNPVPNKTVYVSMVDNLAESQSMSRSIAMVTDANGVLDISNLNGTFYFTIVG
ncbi:MAG TPA: Ig-like domain-containing protein [Actinomycetota bacterium]|nr:Ig-like domain-containing protein [Actinomycetota bacterium]